MGRVSGRSEQADAAAGQAEAGASGALALAARLRRLAAAAAEASGGGLALLFAAAPGEPGGSGAARLRAAAGCASADEARGAARALEAPLLASLHAETPVQLQPLPSLGPRGAAGVALHLVRIGSEVRGALAVAMARPLEPAEDRALADTAERLELLLEQEELRRETLTLRGQLELREREGAERNEEILKLSEALFAQDIEILRSNEELSKVGKLKDDFIEKMSRELRTPLNSIIEAIISVLTGEDDALSEGAKRTLRTALDDGTSFLRTLQNILDLWRIKQNELPVEIQEVNFREVVEEAVFSVQDSIGEKPLVIEQRLQEPFPKLRTDLTKVNQILFLLLDNAVKFTPRGQIEIVARVEDGRLCCELRDTGVGICADDQQFIFDEFYQVDDLASERCRGAGLGLALVRDLLVLLEGSISVSSKVGRGTAVRFELPVHP
jgi:signal transduction histidine kinase